MICLRKSRRILAQISTLTGARRARGDGDGRYLVYSARPLACSGQSARKADFVLGKKNKQCPFSLRQRLSLQRGGVLGRVERHRWAGASTSRCAAFPFLHVTYTFL